jgi:hypothetical protein
LNKKKIETNEYMYYFDYIKMNHSIPENIVNDIVDYIICECGWSKNQDESHAEFSDKNCIKIDWGDEKCYECDSEYLDPVDSFVDVKIRCKPCHLRNMTDYVYGATTQTFIDYEMAGGSSSWWKYRVYFDEHGEQKKCCKISAHGEEDLNDTLYYYIEEADRVLLESEIPEEFMEEFNIVTKY